MGTILASTIIADVARTLQDEGFDRWEQLDHLTELNNAQREIVKLKPSACVANASVQLAQGTRQTIPADGIRLVNLTRNMGTGSTPGAAITQVSRSLIDRHLPGWHSATASATVENFIFDAEDPQRFYVYPPQPETPGYVELIYSQIPADVATVGDPITLDDIHDGDLRNYLLFRAYAMETDPYSEARAVAYWNQFATGLSRMDLLRKTDTPKKRKD